MLLKSPQVKTCGDGENSAAYLYSRSAYLCIILLSIVFELAIRRRTLIIYSYTMVNLDINF